MDNDRMTLQDALLGGPGLDGYAYQAAIYCAECARPIIEATVPPEGLPYPEAQDSETTPQPVFFGEADTAQHCDQCGEYLYGPEEED